MKLAAFQLVNGRTLIGRISEDDGSKATGDGLDVFHVRGPHEFAFIRGAGNQPTPAMMPYTVIPHVGNPVKSFQLFAIHVVAWEWVDSEIEALYTHVTSGIEVQSPAILTPGTTSGAGTGKIEIAKS